MEMKEYIEIGEKRAGRQIDLAKYLGITGAYIRMIKSGRSSLPVPLCMKLGELINEDPIKIISASNLVIEKKEDRRKILKKYLHKSAELVSVLGLVGIISIMTLVPSNPVVAGVIAAEQFILCSITKIKDLIINMLKISIFDNDIAYA